MYLHHDHDDGHDDDDDDDDDRHKFSLTQQGYLSCNYSSSSPTQNHTFAKPSLHLQLDPCPASLALASHLPLDCADAHGISDELAAVDFALGQSHADCDGNRKSSGQQVERLKSGI